MVNILSSLLLALIILIIVLIATFIVSVGFLFIGGILANWFSLTRLEATAVTLVVGILLTWLVVRIIELPVPFVSTLDELEDDEEEPPPHPRSTGQRRRQKRQR